MKKLMFLFAAVCLLSLNTFAQVNQDFTLVNNTGVAIHSFYVGPNTDTDSWGEDLLNGSTLENGESLEVTFNASDYPNVCSWDARVEDKDGNSLSWFDIDLCKWTTVSLFWDAEKGKGWAEFK